MGFTTEAVETAIINLNTERESEDDSRYGYEDVYSELHSGESLEIEGLGMVEHVDSYGGEGQGDDYWVVFKIEDQFFRKDGYYASYDGGELDGELYEVKPKEVTVIQYEVA